MKKVFTDEDLENNLEDQEELLQPSEKKVVKRSKKKDRRSQAEVDSDEDLPEVFSMSEGKSLAQQLRNEERATIKRIAADAKKKKQERAERKKNEKKSRMLEMVEGQAKDDSNVQKEWSAASGMLSDSIVKFLSEHERVEVEKKESDPTSVEVKPKTSSKRKREKTNGGVQVIVLDRDSPKVQEHAGLQFKQDHLYGNRIKRDSSMLQRITRGS